MEGSHRIAPLELRKAQPKKNGAVVVAASLQQMPLSLSEVHWATLGRHAQPFPTAARAEGKSAHSRIQLKPASYNARIGGDLAIRGSRASREPRHRATARLPFPSYRDLSEGKQGAAQAMASASAGGRGFS